MPIDLNQKIYVAGHRGMVGSAITRHLKQKGYKNLVTKSKWELNLCSQNAVAQFFESEKPDQLYIAAAKVGGIYANNSFPAEFIYENLMIEANLIHQAFVHGVKRLLFLGSSCIYPKNSNQPMSESQLLSSPLEPTNEPYAIAKIAGIKLCESYNRQYGCSHNIDYRSIMPTNLYGPGDNYHAKNSHVIPGLIRRFHEAKIANQEQVVIWGTGKVLREFLHVDDLASAAVHVMDLPKDIYESKTLPTNSHLNVGSGVEISIAELANLIASKIGYDGKIIFDTEMPEGPARKLLDSSKITQMGWSAKIEIAEGLSATYKEYLNSIGNTIIED